MPPSRSFGPSLPFPFPLSIGTDICQISRVARILRGRNAERFIRRVLAPDEHRLDEVMLVATNRRLREFFASSPEFKFRPGRATPGTGMGALVKKMLDEEEEQSVVVVDTSQTGKVKEEEELVKGTAVEEKEEEEASELWKETMGRLRQYEAQVRLIRGEALLLGLMVGNPAEMSDSYAAAEDVAAATQTFTSWNPQRQQAQRAAEELALKQEAADMLHRAATFMSGRFAAKEAVIKAHSMRVTFHDIVIERQMTRRVQNGQGQWFAKGAPVAVVRPPDGGGGAAQQHLVSISHDGDYSTAMCLAYRPDLERRV